MVFQGARGPCGVPPASPLLSVACSGAPRVFPHVCLPFVSFYPFIFGAKYPHSRAAGPSEPVVICRPLHAVDARPCLPARVWPHNSHCIQYVPIIREREGREGGDKERERVCVCALTPLSTPPKPPPTRASRTLIEVEQLAINTVHDRPRQCVKHLLDRHIRQTYTANT